MKPLKIALIFISLLFGYISSFAQIKIMSYNIRYDSQNDGENRWDLRKNELVKLLEYYHPDFIGIQEAMPHQFKFIAEHLDHYNYLGHGRDGLDTDSEATPIFYDFTKYELLTKDLFWLSSTPKQISKGLGNTVRAIGSPLTGLTLAGSEFADINPIRFATEDEEGIFKYDEKFGSLKEDPSFGQAGAELLLPEQIKRVAGKLPKGIMSNFFGLQGLSKFGKIGALAARAPSVMTPVGLTLLGAEGIKKLYDEEQKKNRMIEAMDPEEKLQFLEEEKATEEFISRSSAAYGGRMGFADGPEDPKKRKFMKIMGGLASIPLLGRFIDIGTQAPKVAEVLRRGADGVPDFIIDLIAKVKAKAEATGMKYFTGNRSDEFADVYQADNYVVTEQGNKTIIREVDQDGDMLYKENQIEIEVDPETGGVTYTEASARPDGEGKLKDVEEYIEDSDLENMRKYTYDE